MFGSLRRRIAARLGHTAHVPAHRMMPDGLIPPHRRTHGATPTPPHGTIRLKLADAQLDPPRAPQHSLAERADAGITAAAWWEGGAGSA